MATGVMRRSFAALAEMVRGMWTGPLTSSSPELARLWGAPATSTGIGVNETTALTYSAFWACVNAISTDVASYPLIHYKRLKGSGKERYTDSKLYRIVHDEPNPEMTSFTFRQTLTAHALTWGGGYAEIVRDGSGSPIALWPLTPNRVMVGRGARGQIQYEVARPDGGPADVLPAMNMLHVPGLGFDGMVGYSVVAKARESIGLGLATEQFGGTFFGNGATFGGVISYPGPRPTELSEKNYRESLEVTHQGVARAHKMLALYNGAKYERGNGIPPDDAQFLETRLHQVEEMCRWFRMPPHKIQHLLRSTNNNIEHQGIEYYTDTTRPWCVRWEQECNRKLIAPSERRIQFFEHMIEGALRGDLPSRYAAYAIGRNWGWLSADDVREKENMNPLPEGQGQIYLLPSNMVPANRIDEVIDKQVAPDPKPVAPAEPDADPKDDDAAVAAANARAEAAEHAATEARALAQQERETRIAAEAAGTATADELVRLRESEAGARALSVQLTSLSDELRIRADALAAEVSTEHDSRLTAETRATTAEQERDDLRAVVTVREAERDEARATLTASVIERERLDGELAARDGAIGDYTQRLEQLATMTEQLSTLHATVDEREAALATARVAVADSAARIAADAEARTVEAAARADVEATLVAAREASHQLRIAVLGAHRALVVDAWGRMVRRETEKARRHQATPEKLRAWIAAFYETHEDVCVEALRPAMRTHLAWKQSSEDVDTVTLALVRDHIAESQAQLRALLDGVEPEDVPAMLERMLTKWETQRPETLADRILKDEIDHVRSL